MSQCQTSLCNVSRCVTSLGTQYAYSTLPSFLLNKLSYNSAKTYDKYRVAMVVGLITTWGNNLFSFSCYSRLNVDSQNTMTLTKTGESDERSVLTLNPLC